MRKLLFYFFFIFSVFTKAQNKVTFTYDSAGNQITRVLCINCLQKTGNNTKQPDVIVDNELEKLYSEDTISYYPNPVKEELYVQWQFTKDNFVKEINIYSVNGQLLYAYPNISENNSQIIPFQNYPAGIYIVLLNYSNGGQKSIKIIKQ